MVVALLGGAAAGCGGAERPTAVPGETDIEVEQVTLEPAEGSALTPEEDALLEGLGMRAPGLVLPGRTYSTFREAEDRRRIAAYWQNFGFFDVEVDDPEVDFDADEESVRVHWVIEENTRYSVASVHLKRAPEGYEEALRDMIPFEDGTRAVDLEAFRRVRIAMHEHLRDEGFGHATVYSRAFVDREAKKIHWYYYVDAGPKTTVGEVSVDGNAKVPAELIKERVGLRRGDRYARRDKTKREFDLLDTGAFASAFIRTSADTEFIPPGEAPDTGGTMRPEQIDDEGNFVPRELPEDVDLEISVVEAPSRQLRARADIEADPSRIDTTLSSRLWLRNLFGPLHHLVVEGRAGYGRGWRGDVPGPTGVYGDALVRYIKPMMWWRLLDFRLTGRVREAPYPGFYLREVTSGPGFRSTLARDLFLDVDALFRWGLARNFGPFDDATRSEHHLPDDDVYLGGELQGSLIWDRRDNPVEALEGHFLALRSSFSPGGASRWNPYLTLRPEARYLQPLTDAWALGFRGDAGFAVFDDESGLPLGPRFFGGGAHGMRGFGRDRMSPYASACRDGTEGEEACEELPIGGQSLAEASIEARFLPELSPYGGVGFVDLGGVGKSANPFDAGVNLAAGLGLRLRFWYLPAAIDVGYRILRENRVQTPADDPLRVFFRIGEAF